MAELQITCLGEFQVTLAGTPLTLFQTDKNRALLPYLALEAGVHQRTELAQLLWPGYSDASARNSLDENRQRFLTAVPLHRDLAAAYTEPHAQRDKVIQ